MKLATKLKEIKYQLDACRASQTRGKQEVASLKKELAA
jgi:hypothetical protein